MTATWVTVVVAVLTAVTGLGGALGGQKLASDRTARLEVAKRDAARADRDRDERRRAYVRFVAVARSFYAVARTADRGRSDELLAELRVAGAEVELANPALWDEHAATVVETGEGWLGAASKEGPTGPAARGAAAEYETALTAVRVRMRSDLAWSLASMDEGVSG